MTTQNLHTHTVFDDGRDTPYSMARGAIDAGLTSLGFSAHAVMPYENDWCLTEERLAAYFAAIAAAKSKFSDRLIIYNGLELDMLSAQSTDGFDYIIGSLHHIQIGGCFPSIDDKAALTEEALNRFFNGDKNAMAQAYFSQYAAMAADARVDIVGHFDLLSKYDETDYLFDSQAPTYRDSSMAAMELLLNADKLFEVNTGAISRGYRTEPYPCTYMLRELKARGARVLISSDAHSADTLTYGFRNMEALLHSLGFRETWEYTPDGFQPRPL